MVQTNLQSSLLTCGMKEITANTKAQLEDALPICNFDNIVQNGEGSCGEKIVVPIAGDTFVGGLGIVLSLWVQEAVTSGTPHNLGRFHSSRPPPISVQNYIQRLRKLFRCSDECFVVALVYMDKIGKHNSTMAVCDLTVHRLLLIAVMIAAKFHDDSFYDNRHYGKAGGVTTKEVNLLEAAMLKALDWRAHVTAQEYVTYHDLVCTAVRFQA